MSVDGNIVDLKSVKAPFLNVVAQNDLVPLASSTALNDDVGSKDQVQLAKVEIESWRTKGACYY